MTAFWNMELEPPGLLGKSCKTSCSVVGHAPTWSAYKMEDANAKEEKAGLGCPLILFPFLVRKGIGRVC